VCVTVRRDVVPRRSKSRSVARDTTPWPRQLRHNRQVKPTSCLPVRSQQTRPPGPPPQHLPTAVRLRINHALSAKGLYTC